jgi:hypothetical protein
VRAACARCLCALPVRAACARCLCALPVRAACARCLCAQLERMKKMTKGDCIECLVALGTPFAALKFYVYSQAHGSIAATWESVAADVTAQLRQAGIIADNGPTPTGIACKNRSAALVKRCDDFFYFLGKAHGWRFKNQLRCLRRAYHENSGLSAK